MRQSSLRDSVERFTDREALGRETIGLAIVLKAGRTFRALLRGASLLLALALAGSLPAPAAAAETLVCGFNVGYPGDSAPKAALAAWMASGAIRAGLPGELPVMGALVESELTNRSFDDQDAVGFFQMRLSIWNQGQYAGFPGNPELQLKWFVDQAITVNRRRATAGQPRYGDDSSLWGEWVADVLRPPEQYRGRYQLRLADARELIRVGCGAAGVPVPGSGAQQVDTTAPLVRLAGRRVQDPIRRSRIVVEASCPAEACVASARGTLSLPGAARVHRIKSSSKYIPKGGRARLKLRLNPRLRRALKRTLKRRKPLRARISVTARDASGNAASARRVVTLKH